MSSNLEDIMFPDKKKCLQHLLHILVYKVQLNFATLCLSVCTARCILNEPLLPRVMLRLSMSWQVKPVHPLCGTTKPGAIFTQTGRRRSLRSWPRTSSTRSSPLPKSSSCFEIQLRGTVERNVGFPAEHICFKRLLFVQQNVLSQFQLADNGFFLSPDFTLTICTLRSPTSQLRTSIRRS